MCIHKKSNVYTQPTVRDTQAVQFVYTHKGLCVYTDVQCVYARAKRCILMEHEIVHASKSVRVYTIRSCVYTVKQCVYTTPLRLVHKARPSCTRTKIGVYTDVQCVYTRAKRRIHMEHEIIHASKSVRVYTIRSCVYTDGQRVYTTAHCVYTDVQCVYNTPLCLVHKGCCRGRVDRWHQI